jgi:hypothetical protein
MSKCKSNGTSKKKAFAEDDASACHFFRKLGLLIVFQRFIAQADEWLLHVPASAVLRVAVVFKAGSSAKARECTFEQHCVDCWLSWMLKSLR